MIKLYINYPRYDGDRDKLALVKNGIEIWRGPSTSGLITCGYVISHEVKEDATGHYRPILTEGQLGHRLQVDLEETAEMVSYELMAASKPKLIEYIYTVFEKGGTAQAIEREIVSRLGPYHLTVQLAVGAAYFLEARRGQAHETR